MLQAPLQNLDFIDLALRYLSVFLDVVLQKWRMRRLPDLKLIGQRPEEGTTVVITGPTSGIGTETAAEFARRGCRVILACRSPERGADLKERIEAEAKICGTSRPLVEVMQLDLASLDSVRAFCDRWEKSQRPLHILVNNAGVFAMGAPRSTTRDGQELHLGTNYLAAFLLTMRLLPSLRKGGEELRGSGREARVVMVSSKLHEIGTIHTADPQLSRSYSSAAAYGQSKLAQVMFVAELRRRIPEGWNVGCYSVHPGNVMTEVVRTLPRVVQRGYRLVMRTFLLTWAQGARATLFAATDSAAKLAGEATHGYFDSDCSAKKPSSFATDEAVARWLWRFSCDMVDLPEQYSLPKREG
uniref:Forever young oxidoreductase n=2 Tax=Tetraselmis sp. GSL018 TaxID=582737 RepID=A0A061S982_9CHLO|mmetsp:Transcript_36928/g.87741  ORF Transcript_36928/g.87741 Transcript_36928/m.87741 type:complete len:356 (+) Transcript_36928:34-1101(+)